MNYRFHPLLFSGLLMFVLAATFTPPISLADPGSSDRPYWNDIEVIRENVESPRAWFRAYPEREAARTRNIAQNEYFQSLNGIWKFHYSESPDGRPEDFHQAESVQKNLKRPTKMPQR